MAQEGYREYIYDQIGEGRRFEVRAKTEIEI